MQASSGGGGNVEGGEGIGPGRLGGGGLHRFRSAPATWLDVLLDDNLTRDDSFRIGPNNPGGLTHLLSAGTADPPLPPPQAPTGIARSNSTSAYNISAAVADTGFFDAATSGGGGGGGVGVGTVQSLHRHAPNSLEAFNRMNSSPAEFLSSNVDAYFSSFGGGGGGFPSTSYEMLGGAAPLEVSPTSSGKRIRERDAEFPSPSKFPSQLKEELGSGGSLLDMDMEKLLEDTVPFRVRAKRGCATHPRSIAERVRRTKISDRIRKLQELVPNMDKQTNTADMLDEAVEYVKHLQKQIEELTEHQKKCICPARD